MQNIKLVSGFSEMKTLLIQTHKIERDRDLVKLHFSIQETSLLIHDYDHHQNTIELCGDISDKEIPQILQISENAKSIIWEALKEPDPQSN